MRLRQRPPSPPARELDMAGVAELPRSLAALGYTESEVGALLGGHPPYAVERADAPLLRRRLGDAPPTLAALVRLLLLGDTVPRTACAALEPEPLGALEGSSLVEVAGRELRPRGQLVPFAELLVAADQDTGQDDERNAVSGLTPSTLTAATLTPRHAVGRALDLGSGSGVQALLLARHSDAVVGVDVNPRAVALGRLNARVNAVQNVEFRHGEWFEPVRGDRFDTIVANLPFTIGPVGGCRFDRTPAHLANETPRHVVLAAGEHLRPGGHAAVLASWVPPSPQHWMRPLADWVEQTRCDALILRHSLQHADDYAAGQTRRFRWSPEACESEHARWRDALASAGAEWIASGAVVLRRSEATPAWIAAFEDVGPPGAYSTQAIGEIFRGGEVLRHAPSDDALLARPLTLHPGLLAAAAPFPVAGGRPTNYEVERQGGLGVRVTLCDDTFSALRALTPGHSAAHALQRDGIDAASVLPSLRELVASGFVLPA